MEDLELKTVEIAYVGEKVVREKEYLSAIVPMSEAWRRVAWMKLCVGRDQCSCSG
jgi:hypothetical protein